MTSAVTGVENLSFSELTDNGFQLQASSMIIDKKLQIYLSGSKIFGDYGNHGTDVLVQIGIYSITRLSD